MASNYNRGLLALDSTDFEAAKLAFIEAKTISENFSPKYLSEKTNTLFNLGKSYVELELRQEAFPLVKTSLDILKQNAKDNTLNYANKSIYFGNLCRFIEQYEDAIFYFQEALDVFKQKGKNKNIEFAKNLNSIAMTYRAIGDYTLAEKYLKSSLSLIENLYSKTHIEYGRCLSDLSAIYKSQGNYEIAITTAEESISIIESYSGKKNSDYTNAVTNLTQIYEKTGEYSKAIVLQKDVVDSFSDEQKNDIYYAVAIYTLSILYHNVDEFKKEIALLKEVETILGAKSQFLPNLYNNFGQAYDRIGNYEKSLFYSKKSINLTKPTSTSYGTRLQNIAYIYNRLGEKQKTLEFYNAAKDAMEKTHEKTHDDYGKLINNIGDYYYSIGNYTKAEELFKEALTIFLDRFDNNHPQYGYQLNDYAKTLLKLGQEEKAISLMQENIALAKNNLTFDTEAFYNRQFNLANAYNNLFRFEEALPLLKNATTNIKLKFSEAHPDYGMMLKSLGHTYIGLNDYQKALPIMQTSNEVLIKELDQIFKFRSETEKKAFLKVIFKHFDDMQSIPFSNPKIKNSWNELNLNNQLMLKGLLLNNSKDVLSQLRTLDDLEVKLKIDDYRNNKRLLAKVLSQPIIERTVDTDSLKVHINSEESQLVKRYSLEFGDVLKLSKDWKDSRDKLDDNSIVIEFTNFVLSNNNMKTDNIMYAAYIYKRNWKTPKITYLFEERELSSILENTKPNELYNSSRLYDLIWKPINKHVSKSDTIYFSPSGLLNQIQFSALRKINKKSLGQIYPIVQLSSSAILAKEITEPKSDFTLFIGGIDYDVELNDNDSVTKMTSNYKFLNSEALISTKATRSRGESWTHLKGALGEVNTLHDLFLTNNKSSKVLSGKQATEANFKSISGHSPNIIHIATHGFFYENLNLEDINEYNLSTEDQYRLSEDPLLRSGLILAGANYTWKHGSNPNTKEDGILTAMEISNMDLSNTDMVVLSACETGLGDIDSSEGVYGLQRAFKMAGVDIIVMSLWQVPDSETAEFMSLFYKSWIKDKQVRKAFSFAQRTMQEKYYNEPLKWAAFVLFE
ncbi:CHAT domain-containing protein [Psychroserpens sp.]|uniref:CHAT domain-containing protein n=1 Tax=Psychroserpens sp. TaxID=2020870 RepID=UPI00385B95C5